MFKAQDISEDSPEIMVSMLIAIYSGTQLKCKFRLSDFHLNLNIGLN